MLRAIKLLYAPQTVWRQILSERMNGCAMQSNAPSPILMITTHAAYLVARLEKRGRGREMRTMPMIWSKDAMAGHNPCSACGREMKGKQYAVHVINGGSDVLHPGDEGEYQSDSGEMGLHFVGPECRKKFGEFVR